MKSGAKASSEGVNLGEIAARVGAAAPMGDILIRGVAALLDAGPNDLSFVTSEAYLKELAKSRAAAVLVQKNVKLPTRAEGARPVVLWVDDADLAMARVLEIFIQPPSRPPVGIDALARIDPSADIGADTAIGPFITIGKRSRIGRGSILHSHVSIGDDVLVGENCEIFPNVNIRDRITIGARVIINSGCVLGTDGFGYRWDGSRHMKVPHVGTIVIEDDVELGSCVCVDRAKFSVTRIGAGTKIDNLVQVAHNVVIGPNCVIAGQSGLAGSTTLGTGWRSAGR